ncbi:MAG: acylphosphatase [Candidatus Binatus sp.]|jgi:acylphosphatase|uniref:acylphosphatase n=1 Tax=Candidatus Binatus sp. TaxID=2811406 RepID=UPI003D101D03
MTTQNQAGRARLHLIVSGRVQGVGFRFSACDEAKDLALAGWVRNIPSGEVEIVAEGSRESLQMLVAWAHLGTSSAHVTEVREDWLDFTGEFTEFRIR